MVYKLRKAKRSFLPLEKVVLTGDNSKCWIYSKHVIFMSEWIDQFQCVRNSSLICYWVYRSAYSWTRLLSFFLRYILTNFAISSYRIKTLLKQFVMGFTVFKDNTLDNHRITKSHNILSWKEPTRITKSNSSVNGHTGIIMDDFLQNSL